MLFSALNAARKRVALVAAAVFLGVVGVLVLAAGLAAVCAIWMPWPAALIVTAVAFLAGAAILLWFSTLSPAPKAHARKETPEQGPDLLTGLPIEAARRMIMERPLAAVLLFSGFGAMLARSPESAIRLVERYLTGKNL
jgi:hypothetical protein